MAEDPNDWETATQLIRGGLARSPHGETAEPIYLNQSFVYDSPESADARFAGTEPGFIYARYGNPTVKMFEDRLALLEGAEACRATASGMAAVQLAISGLVRAGDHIVSGKALFGSCRWILNNWAPRFGVETTLVHGPDIAAWKAAVRPNTKLFFLETPANPLLEVCDIAAICAIAREIADNTSAVSVALTRRMLWRGLVADHPMEAHRADSRAIHLRGPSKDALEGVGSFLEKRPAKYPDTVTADMPDLWPDWSPPAFS